MTKILRAVYLAHKSPQILWKLSTGRLPTTIEYSIMSYLKANTLGEACDLLADNMILAEDAEHYARTQPQTIATKRAQAIVNAIASFQPSR